MTLTVHLFGPQAQAVGQREVRLELPADATCAHLRDRLRAEVPALGASLNASRFAVNHAFADERRPLRAGDEVALIGMVSGG